jgi:hypothetical protein
LVITSFGKHPIGNIKVVLELDLPAAVETKFSTEEDVSERQQLHMQYSTQSAQALPITLQQLPEESCAHDRGGTTCDTGSRSIDDHLARTYRNFLTMRFSSAILLNSTTFVLPVRSGRLK